MLLKKIYESKFNIEADENVGRMCVENIQSFYLVYVLNKPGAKAKYKQFHLYIYLQP